MGNIFNQNTSNYKKAYLLFNNYNIVDYKNLKEFYNRISNYKDKRLINILNSDIPNTEYEYKEFTNEKFFLLKYIDENECVREWKISSLGDLGFPYVYWDWFEEVEENLFFNRSDLFTIYLFIETINTDDIDDEFINNQIVKYKKSKEFIESFILNSNTRYNDYTVIKNDSYLKIFD
jgi:hypothetical protein